MIFLDAIGENKNGEDVPEVATFSTGSSSKATVFFYVIDPAMKASGIAFVTSTPCPQSGLLGGLRMSQRTSIYPPPWPLSQGRTSSAVINTIGVLNEIKEDFLPSAAPTGGTLARIRSSAKVDG